MLTKLLKSFCFKPMAFLTIIAFVSMSFISPEGVVVLKAGTPVPLELLSTLDSNNSRVGQMVDFRVISDIKSEGKVVIPAGAIAKGQVTRAKKNGLLGAEGELEIQIQTVQAVDGTMIYLSNGRLGDEGNNQIAISVIFTVLCLFGFLIKGGKAQLTAGSQITAIVASDVQLKIE